MSSRNLIIGTLAALTLVLTVGLVGPALSAPAGGSQGPQLATIKWTKLDAAVTAAAKSGKPILVSVYADWCGYCKQMDRTTFVDPSLVKQVSQGWIPVKLNGESSAQLKLGKLTLTESEWAMGNGVQGFPATFLLDSKGKPFAAIPGYLEASQLNPILTDATTYLRAGGPAKLGAFFEWAEKQQR